MYKLDLHTHSINSPDGGLKAEDYRRVINSGRLDFVAITDHNSIVFARELRHGLGEPIIIGEEVTTTDGHLIGLYLKRQIKPGLSAPKTADLIHAQGGLVYVPHPLARIGRQGLSESILDAMAEKVDIIEVHNGRAIGSHAAQALGWAQRHGKAVAASSDAHGRAGWANTYSLVSDRPTRENLLELLARPRLSGRSVGLRGRLYPKFNRLKKRSRHA